eukprot:COSAG02_NODE_8782_length_2448_cov_168.526181_2_plen_84_part_00
MAVPSPILLTGAKKRNFPSHIHILLSGMSGMALLGWRAQPPTPYAHLLPRRQQVKKVPQLQLPREHRFARAATLRIDPYVDPS